MKPREEVANVIRFIKDSLTAAQLFYAIEPIPENPDAFTIAAHDDDGYVNSGILGWDNAAGTVRYFAYDPVRINHNEAEGIENGEVAWETKTAEFFVAHLTGEVREIQAKYQRLLREAEKRA